MITPWVTGATCLAGPWCPANHRPPSPVTRPPEIHNSWLGSTGRNSDRDIGELGPDPGLWSGDLERYIYGTLVGTRTGIMVWGFGRATLNSDRYKGLSTDWGFGRATLNTSDLSIGLGRTRTGTMVWGFGRATDRYNGWGLWSGDLELGPVLGNLVTNILL